jgi:hypothetical protein
LAYVFEGTAEGGTITLSVGTTSFSAQDCYSRWKDWAIASGSWARFAFNAIGGNAIGGGRRAGDYYFLQDGWTIVPQGSGYVLEVTGNLYPATLGVNMFGNANVQIQMERSSLTQTLAVGSGVLPADITSIAATTRDAILTDGTRFAGANIDAAISSAGGLTEPQAAALVELQLRMLELWRLQGLDLSNPLHVAAASRTVGAIAQSIVEASGTTTVTRTT